MIFRYVRVLYVHVSSDQSGHHCVRSLIMLCLTPIRISHLKLPRVLVLIYIRRALVIGYNALALCHCDLVRGVLSIAVIRMLQRASLTCRSHGRESIQLPFDSLYERHCWITWAQYAISQDDGRLECRSMERSSAQRTSVGSGSGGRRVRIPGTSRRGHTVGSGRADRDEIRGGAWPKVTIRRDNFDTDRPDEESVGLL